MEYSTYTAIALERLYGTCYLRTGGGIVGNIDKSRRWVWYEMPLDRTKKAPGSGIGPGAGRLGPTTHYLGTTLHHHRGDLVSGPS